MEKIYGLLGRTLGHSWSAPIHQALGCGGYRLIELEPEQLESFLRREDLGGLNVTIPYKKAVYLKRKMHDLYPRTTYYRILHQERALSPGEQEEIAALFLQTGIDEVPVFDRYTDEYNWDEQHTPKGNAAP